MNESNTISIKAFGTPLTRWIYLFIFKFNILILFVMFAGPLERNVQSAAGAWAQATGLDELGKGFITWLVSLATLVRVSYQPVNNSPFSTRDYSARRIISMSWRATIHRHPRIVIRSTVVRAAKPRGSERPSLRNNCRYCRQIFNWTAILTVRILRG